MSEKEHELTLCKSDIKDLSKKIDMLNELVSILSLDLSIVDLVPVGLVFP